MGPKEVPLSFNLLKPMFPYLSVFGYHIPTYGVLVFTGIAAGILWMLRNSRHYGIKKEDALFFSLYCMAFAFTGAKLLYILVSLGDLIQNPEMWQGVLRGGFVFYGGVIGGIFGGMLYTRRYRLGMFEFFDTAAPSLSLGHAIGRVGCFCAGCCYGLPVDSPFSVVYPKGGLGLAPAGVPMLPVQLFESGSEIILALILFLLLRKNRTPGKIMGWYLVLYGIVRFLLEFLRYDYRGSFLLLSTSQFISLFMIVIGIMLISRLIQRIQFFQCKDPIQP